MSSVLRSIFFPSEIGAMLKLKFGGRIRSEINKPMEELAKELGDLDFCYAVLNKVSRSFAVVIQQLPEELKDAVCIFYLVLRGLDSVEDDMTYDNVKKIPLLREFYKKMGDDTWRLEGVGDSHDYRILMAHFDKVIRVFQTLKPQYQAAILDITQKMGAGMADYANKIGSIDTVASYNLYCHYVAGLVGHGLSHLFSASGLESPDLRYQERISNSMGLFLQKTNIIRDYLEDLDQGRTWWPQEIWSNYAKNLEDFKKMPDDIKSVNCLNHLVMDALQHVPDCLDYLGRLKNQQIFEFCAIPQVMAIATLAECYNNTNIFKGVVKVRKGLSCKLMLNSSNMSQVHSWFYTFAGKIREKIPSSSIDPTAKRITDLVDQIQFSTKSAISPVSSLPQTFLRTLNLLAWIFFISAAAYLLVRNRQRYVDTDLSAPVFERDPWDYVAVLTAFISIGYLFGFFGVTYV